MMSRNLARCCPYLCLTCKTHSKSIRKCLMKDCGLKPENVYDAYREIAVNLVEGNIPLDGRLKKILRRHKKEILNLTKNRKYKCIKNRKKVLEQSGGYMTYLIPLVLNLLSSLRK